MAFQVTQVSGRPLRRRGRARASLGRRPPAARPGRPRRATRRTCARGKGGAVSPGPHDEEAKLSTLYVFPCGIKRRMGGEWYPFHTPELISDSGFLFLSLSSMRLLARAPRSKSLPLPLKKPKPYAGRNQAGNAALLPFFIRTRAGH